MNLLQCLPTAQAATLAEDRGRCLVGARERHRIVDSVGSRA
jgi:hypothetical protein